MLLTIPWIPGYTFDVENQVIIGKRGKPLKFYRQICWYYSIGSLNKYWLTHVHRIFATAIFWTIPDGYEVDHIDGNKTNNHHSNLRIVPTSQNRPWKTKGVFVPRRRPVRVGTRWFDSMSECARHFGWNKNSFCVRISQWGTTYKRQNIFSPKNIWQL